MNEHSSFDWADLARLVEKHCQPLPQYDGVIVDEAQDFPPSDLNLTTLIVSGYSESRDLTLLADPAQSIYYRGIPWKDAGVYIQGRARILANNFRNTHLILAASSCILEGCDDLKAANEYIRSSSSHRHGAKPKTVMFNCSEDSQRFLIEEIIRLSQSGKYPGKYRLGDFAILAKKSEQFKRAQKSLQGAHINRAMFRADGFHICENDVEPITMYSAKGLEFPVVFMIDLNDDDIPFIKRYSESKYEDELHKRKLFYVSMTRAAERLYRLQPQRSRSRILRDLDDSTIMQIQR